jgi:hypothetical protein
MTREFAVQVSKALDDLESFEVFMDMIDQVVLRAEDELGIDLGDFNDKLQALMTEELNRRNFILEGM